MGAIQALRTHWPEYLMEAALLGCFMVSACVVTVMCEFPSSLLRQMIASALLRRFLNGICMGLTAMGIVYSPWGKQSGAHINPAVTLTFLRLGKIGCWDALFYSCAQFAGATAAVFLCYGLLGSWLSDSSICFVVTVPGTYGRFAAGIGEFLISAGMMIAVLYCTNHAELNQHTGALVGLLLVLYVTVESPFSGMSMNPARSFGSAFPSDVWSSFWIYLIVPPVAMLSAAELYVLRYGPDSIQCCKLHHRNNKRCVFCGAHGDS